MGTATRLSTRRHAGMLVMWLVGVLMLGELFGAEMGDISRGTSATPAEMVLRVQDGLLSLQAQEASLKAIFDAIGRQLSIEVVTRIPADERITIAFDQLSLREALKRFHPRVNYLVLEDAAKAPGTIRKLIVVSKRTTGVPSLPTMSDGDVFASPAPRQSPTPTPQSPAPTPGAPERPKPFRFEFDPTAAGERGR